MTTMRNNLRFAPVLLLAASLAGCQGPCQKLGGITAPALTSGSADFTRFVAVGTSISAGYQSGGLVNRHQVRAFPALFAQQVGRTVRPDSGNGAFSFDAVNGNGLPPLMQLRSLSPLVISNSGLAPGNMVNYRQPGDYQNLAVPGALALDFADSTDYPANAFFSVVGRHRGTIAQQVLRQNPTFISFEYGANEVLGAATRGSLTYLFPPATYAAILTGEIDAIHAATPNARLAIFNVPDVTAIPFCTTFKPYTVSLSTGAVVPLLGPDSVALDPARDLVLLTAGPFLATGTGFPVGSYNYLNPAAPGNGHPLPDAVVLSGVEQDTIKIAVTAMNQAVDAVATLPWVVKVDLNGLLSGIAASGYTIGSTHYTGAFVTGGLFSLDGIHPNDLAHAIIANTMIDAVNAKFGATVGHVDLATAASLTSAAARPALPGEEGLRGMQIDGLEQGLGMIFKPRR